MDLSGTYTHQPVNRIGREWQAELVRPILTEMDRQLLRLSGSNGRAAVTSHHALSDLTYFDDHPQYLYLAGRASGQTLTSKSAATVPFSIKGAASQSANLQEWQNSSGTPLAYVRSSGSIFATGSLQANTLANYTTVFAGSIEFSGTPGTGQIKSTAGSIRLGPFSLGANSIVEITHGVSINTNLVGDVNYVRLEVNATSGQVADAFTVRRHTGSRYFQVDNTGRLFINPDAGLPASSVPLSIRAVAATDQLQFKDTSNSVVAAITTDGAYKFIAGAGVGKVWTSDVNGVGSWTTLAASTFPHVMLDSTVHTDTLTGTVVLGDLLHGNATPKWARLAGNITTTKKWLNQTGNGAVSAVPSWDALAAADLPAHTHASAAQGGATLTPTQVTVTAASAATVPLTLVGAASQSANFFTVNNSSAVLVSQLTPAGQFYAAHGVLLGTGVSTNAVHLTTEAVTSAQNTLYLPNLEFGTLIARGSGSDPPSAGEIASVNRTLSANVSPAVNLTNATAAGMYLIQAHCVVTAGGTGTLTCSIGYTTDGGAVAPTLFLLSMSIGGNVGSGTRLAWLASGNITWSVTGYSSGTYVMRIRVIYLGT